MTYHSATHAGSRRLISLLFVLLAAVLVTLGSLALATTTAGSALVTTGLRDADGYVPDGVRVAVDDSRPAVSRLQPDLHRALIAAAAAAEADGTILLVSTGWRSRAYQQVLVDQAVGKYGSAAQAAKWVASPGTSSHVQGLAVDIGPAPAAGWLRDNGFRYGLCRTYANEPWHFQLTGVPGQPCPAPLADAAAK